MKLSLSRKDLLAGLARVSTVPEKRGLMPALTCVGLRTDGDALILGATDLIVSVDVRVPCEAKAQGSAAINCADFVARIKAMPEGPIGLTFEAKNMRCTISAPGSPRKFTLAYLNGDDFPRLPQATWAEASILSSGQIRKLLGAVDHAISSDVTRPHLASLHLAWSDKTITASATDGHRAARHTITVGTSNSRTWLVPAKGVMELSRAVETIAEPEEMVELDQCGHDIFFRSGAWTMAVRLTDASFPPLDQVIPKNARNTLIAAREPMIDAIKSVALSASESGGGIAFHLSDNKCCVTSESAEHGSANDELACDYNGPALKIGFNASYLLDAIKTLDCDEVLIDLGGELEPGVFKANAKDAGGTNVIMPLRI
jgi:DNA polymerase III subunit beta